MLSFKTIGDQEYQVVVSVAARWSNAGLQCGCSQSRSCMHGGGKACHLRSINSILRRGSCCLQFGGDCSLRVAQWLGCGCRLGRVRCFFFFFCQYYYYQVFFWVGLVPFRCQAWPIRLWLVPLDVVGSLLTIGSFQFLFFAKQYDLLCFDRSQVRYYRLCMMFLDVQVIQSFSFV